jgi:hypothetical protein
VEVLDVRLVQVQLGHGGRDLGIREDADLRPLGEEALDLFEFLQFHY